MTSSHIPENVRRLVTQHLPSVERMEILLLLFRGKGQSWKPETVEQQIRSTPESIQQNLSALAASRLIVADPQTKGFRFGGDTELQQSVTSLASAYRARRAAIIELIYSAPR